MPSFQIADCPTNLTTVESGDGAQRLRQGKLSLTVRNVAATSQTARIAVEASEGADPAWFAIEGAPPTGPQLLERDFDPNATQTIAVAVKVPPYAPPKTYSFRVKVTAEADPDNDFTEGPAVSLVVPPLVVKPPAKPFPWWAVAVAAVFLVVVVVGAIFLLRPNPLELPMVVGLTPAEARAALITAGFEDAGITEETGAAVGQEPGRVAEARQAGDQVTLIIDPGVPVRAAFHTPLEQALTELANDGLQPNVQRIAAGNVPFFLVETADPVHGTPVRLGETIDITTYVPGGGGGSRPSVIDSIIIRCPPFCLEVIEREQLPPSFVMPILPPGGVDVQIDPGVVVPRNPNVNPNIFQPAPP